MRSHLLVTAVVAPLALASLATAASAQPLQVVSADAGGVTLRLSLPAYRLSAPSAGGRTELSVPGFQVTGLPGRPNLPYAQTLVALPPGAGATARVLDAGAEEPREGVRLTLGGTHVMRDDGEGLGLVPAVEPAAPVLDGPWPAAPVELSAPLTVRGQRVVAVQVRPFRYDEASGRLWVRRAMLVRVDFTGATAAGAAGVAPASDSHWEPVFRSALANYEQGRLWRVARASAGGPAAGRLRLDRAARPAAVPLAAFDEDEPEVRIRVDTTGVYSFPYDELVTRGYPAGVPVGEVSLHRHEYVGQEDPPYVTIELAIEVDDADADGVFGPGDAIIAFVPNWVERSGVTSMVQREWGDAEVVFATRLAGGAGRRVPARTGWRGAAGLTPLASYPATWRWERSFKYFGFPPAPDTAYVERLLWTSYAAYYTRPDSFRFETNHLDTTRSVVFRLLLQGTNNSVHDMFAQVRNGAGRVSTVVDSLVWYDRSRRITATTLPGGALSEGLTNRLVLWGKGSTGAPDPATVTITNSGLNWYEATYWRSFRAIDGYLDAGSGDATGLYQVHASGFSSPAIRLYDVTDIVNPVRLSAVPVGADGDGYAVDFQDSTGAAALRYVAFDRPRTVASSRYSAVTRRGLAGFSGPRDYVVIAPEAFLPAASSLAALRQGQGLDTLVAALESVNDEFNGGRKSKYAIRRFLQWAYGGSGWDTRFVTLLGDGSEDGRGILNGSSPDWVPVPLIPGPVAAGTLGLEMVAADPWYGACLGADESCWSSGRVEPELYVGRLPVNSLEQANGVVAKLAAYESLADDATWRRRMLLLADDCYSSVSTFGGGSTSTAYCYHGYEIVFRQLNEAVRTVLTDAAGLGAPDPGLLDLRSYLTDPSLYEVEPDGDTCRVGSPTGMGRAEGLMLANFDPVFFREMNEGVLWWNYQGHANAHVLSHEGFYRSQENNRHDYENFLNDGRLFFFSAFSCHANAFGNPQEATNNNGPSVGETMLTLAGRGAVASYASSAYELVPSSGSYHLNVEFARSLFENPPHDDEMGRGVTDRGARVVLGEAIALTMLNFLPTVPPYSGESGVSLTYNLLGDPATRLWVGPAQITVTVNGQPVTSGEPVRLSSGGDVLQIEAELVSNVAIDTIRVFRTDAGGTSELDPALYTLTPAFPDTSASGRGGRRYHLSYTTALASGQETFTLQLTDRYDIRASFDIVFEFQTQLFAGGVPVQAGDVVAPDAALTLLVLSPGTVNPDSLELEVDGTPQAFTWTLTRGDTTGRQYLLAWEHAPYASGAHVVRLRAPGGLVLESPFRVEGRFALADALAFPNPFDDDAGTRFVFTLTGDSPTDVLVRVFTASGRRIYEARVDGLPPGHHEIPWDGRDAEGQKLANGVYFFKLVAHGSSGTSAYDGRLVKLRKPRRAADTAATP
jgi:hypothetical protein